MTHLSATVICVKILLSGTWDIFAGKVMLAKQQSPNCGTNYQNVRHKDKCKE